LSGGAREAACESQQQPAQTRPAHLNPNHRTRTRTRARLINRHVVRTQHNGATGAVVTLEWGENAESEVGQEGITVGGGVVVRGGSCLVSRC